MYPFQDVIKEIMDLNNLSGNKLAAILGVEQSTVGQWLRGTKKPSYNSIKAIYEKFGIEPNVLFGIGN